MKTNKPAERPDPPHGAPAVDPNLGHHPPSPPTPGPALPQAGGKGRDQPRVRPRISEHGRGRNPK